MNENQKQYFTKEKSESTILSSEEIRLDSDDCSENFANSSTLENHIQDNYTEETLNCNFCQYSSNFGDIFIEHIAYHLDPEESEDELEDFFVSLTCPICKEDSPCLVELQIHFMTEHLAKRKLDWNENLKIFNEEVSTENSQIQEPDSGNSKIICDDKSDDSATKLELESVNQKSQTAKRLNCNFCQYSSSVVEDLTEHIAKHLDPYEECAEPYEDSSVRLSCAICKEDSDCVISLEIHFMIKHLTDRKLECDYCGWRCYYKNNMVNHITSNHVIKSVGKMYDESRASNALSKAVSSDSRINGELRIT